MYAAKSTEDRHGSIPDQLRECRTVIEGLEQRTVFAEYTDEAVSAFTRNRGRGLADAMQHAEDLALDRALRAARLKPANPSAVRIWRDEEIIRAIRIWTARNGHPPLGVEWRRGTPRRPCKTTMHNHFGTWAAALSAAGIEP
jgi:hypothetical protein